VDVVVNYVRRRRGNLRRRHHPDRHRAILRYWQHEGDHGRRRWRQVDEVDRRRRQKDHRRRGRRSKVKIRIVEREHRTPRDECEGMLAAQMIACHNASMECYRRAMLSEQTFEGRRENLNQANKLSRTYSALLDSLNRHRGKDSRR